MLRNRTHGLFVVIGIIIICILGYFFLRTSSIEKTTSIVQKNKDTLTGIATEIMNEKNVDGYHLHGVKQIYCWNDTMVDFLCRSSGFASSTSYSGFYYSPDDVPLGFQGESMNFEEAEHGWKYTESEGDNWYYTEKICDNWYAYEMHF